MFVSKLWMGLSWSGFKTTLSNPNYEMFILNKLFSLVSGCRSENRYAKSWFRIFKQEVSKLWLRRCFFSLP